MSRLVEILWVIGFTIICIVWLSLPLLKDSTTHSIFEIPGHHGWTRIDIYIRPGEINNTVFVNGKPAQENTYIHFYLKRKEQP